jgi:hypothetical protein
METTNLRIDELEKRVDKLEKLLTVAGTATVAKTKKLSVKEFLMTKTLKSEIQKAIALGYFLENFDGMESFNVDDLERAFRAAKEKPPKNMNDVVNKNIAKGLVMAAKDKKGSKKAWCLTSSGEKYVENDLGANSD